MPQLPKSQSGRIVSIQVCRGLAALLVVGVHLHGIETKFCTTNHTLLFEHGTIGVDIFFVISGIVIASVTTGAFGNPREAFRFLCHRLARIFPIFWIYTTLTLIAYQIRPTNIDASNRSFNLLASYFLLPTNHRIILIQGWTLNEELYFYLSFFLLLFVPRRIAPWLLALWGIAIVALKLHIGLSPSALVQLLISPMALEFLAGCLIFHIYRRSRLRKTAGILLIFASLAWLAAIITYSLHAHAGQAQWIVDAPWKRPLLFGSFAAIFLLGAVELERTGLIRSLPLLESIGDWSYSIYLSHILVLELIARILFTFHASIFTIALICLPAVVLVGYVSYTYVERPIITLLYQFLPQKSHTATQAKSPSPV